MSTEPHSSLILHLADRCLRVGEIDAGPRRMRGEVWVVFHAGAGWTHLYRIDAREGRTVHLLRCARGECLQALERWARATLALGGKAAPVPNGRAPDAEPLAA